MNPTEQELNEIKKWPSNDAKALLEFVHSLWEYGDSHFSISYDTEDGITVYRFITGGWSGNEDLIAALHGNAVFWSMFWQSSTRGGIHVFKVPN